MLLCLLSCALLGLTSGIEVYSCALHLNGEKTIIGTVDLHVRGKVLGRRSSHVRVRVEDNDHVTEGLHGFHIHQHSVADQDCGTAGGHYNPHGVNHGDPASTGREDRHVGDLGNVYADSYGEITADIVFRESLLTERGELEGRSIVLHAAIDDLGRGGDSGSLKTGNAGARVACCTLHTGERRRIEEEREEEEEKKK